LVYHSAVPAGWWIAENLSLSFEPCTPGAPAPQTQIIL
jgi:hypothetical protein